MGSFFWGVGVFSAEDCIENLKKRAARAILHNNNKLFSRKYISLYSSLLNVESFCIENLKPIG